MGAADEIARAIAAVNRLAHPIDVLVVGRGGGSLEDLWAFNEEAVVRAIHASRIPVVSAVGHEIDVTLSDLVADLRALTPSEAAERVVPAIDEVLVGLKNHHKRLAAALRGRVADARGRLDGLAARRIVRKPFDRLHDLVRQLDGWDERASRAMRNRLQRLQQQVAADAGRLESLSPLGVLARGYSLTTHQADDRLIEDAATLSPGELIKTRLARGTAISRVESTS
jgi:exodeoxyribonuclease VII large subunit